MINLFMLLIIFGHVNQPIRTDIALYFYNNHCFYFVVIRLLYNSLLALSSRKLPEQRELKTTRDYMTTMLFWFRYILMDEGVHYKFCI